MAGKLPFCFVAIKAYVLRHGSTAISPNPEGWQQIPLDRRGIEEAREAGQFLCGLISQGYPAPRWGVSSDLERAIQTLDIVASVVDMTVVEPMISLRAYEKHEETAISYELRNMLAFDIILARAFKSGRLPLIACHRSSTAWLAKTHGIIKNPDYREDALLQEGGLLALTDHGIKPLFRVRPEAWKQLSKGELANA